MDWWKTVLHVHTNYSFDSNTTCSELIETAVAQGVKCIAVTDHDEITGALEARRLGAARGVNVIVGEEISSSDGHIIGLFLRERISPRLSAETTAAAIRAQGGLVLAPHPYARLCDGSLRHGALQRLLPWLDAVEVCNAQNFFVWENRAARGFADRYILPAYVGADTHIRGYLAAAYQLMPAFDGPAAFRAALRHAKLVPGRFGPGYFAAMGFRHVWDLVMPIRWPGFGANVPAGSRARTGTLQSQPMEQPIN